MTQHDPTWLLDEAWRQVGRARTLEDTSRALSTFRRAIGTAQRHAGATPELLERIRQLEAAAGELYDAQQDEHVRKAVRALASLRMALETRLSVKAGRRKVLFRAGSAEWEMDGDEAARFYGIPPEHLRDGRRIVVRLSFTGQPDVRVLGQRGKLLWRSSSNKMASPIVGTATRSRDRR